MILKHVEHLLVQDHISKIRKSGISSKDFRENMMEIGRIMSYILTDTLKKEKINVQTTLGISECIIIKDKKDIVVINVLRAAIPLVDGILKVFNESECGLVGAWREDIPPFKVNVNYSRIPPVKDKIVIIADPMLATGNTLNVILDEIKNQGIPKRIIIFNAIASKEGIEKISKYHNDVEIYTCAIDNEVNSKGYIVPGLGDAGDISFGKPSNK